MSYSCEPLMGSYHIGAFLMEVEQHCNRSMMYMCVDKQDDAVDQGYEHHENA